MTREHIISIETRFRLEIKVIMSEFNITRLLNEISGDNKINKKAGSSYRSKNKKKKRRP